MSESPVFRSTEDWKWYFWDESWSTQYGPYETEEEARAGLKKYCEEVLGT